MADSSRQRRTLTVLFVILVLTAVTATPAMAREPIIDFTQVRPPRTDPAPIPHTDVLDPGVTMGYVLDNVRPQSIDAFLYAAEQEADTQPGIFQTATPISNGIYLKPGGAVCNDFNIEDGWQGKTWTNYFGGWGPFAADDGYFQAKNVTFDREQVVGPGNDFGPDSASMKIASNQPYDAGIMSPPIPVQPGDEVTVVVYYLIYNHNDHSGVDIDYASLGVIPGLGEHGQYVQGYHRGEWAELGETVTATGESIQVMLQGYSPYSLNSNIYFDDVIILVNGDPVSECRW